MEGTTLDWIVEHLTTLITAIGIIASPLLVLWYKRYLDMRDKIPHNVTTAVEKNKRLDALCSDLQDKLRAQRVVVWLFHNGGYYYTGEPIQKLSVICEKNDDDVEPIIHISQNQPISIFQRNLEKLTENDYFYEYNEQQYKDSLSVLNNLYGIISSGIFKLKNKEGYFAGVLCIGYNRHHAITSGEVEIIKEIACQVEVELSNHKVK